MEALYASILIVFRQHSMHEKDLIMLISCLLGPVIVSFEHKPQVVNGALRLVRTAAIYSIAAILADFNFL